jgi:hypothetical protein
MGTSHEHQHGSFIEWASKGPARPLAGH